MTSKEKPMGILTEDVKMEMAGVVFLLKNVVFLKMNYQLM